MPDKEASKPTPPADVQVPEKRLEPNPENNRPNTPINAPLSPIDDATTDKAVDDIFKTLNQDEDDARVKIGKLKRAPTAIKSTEPDY